MPNRSANIVPSNLDDKLKDKPHRRAAKHQRSISAESRETVRAAPTRLPPMSAAVLKTLAADIRALSAGCPQTPSEDLLRESRDQQ